jgi:hypothetical protein
MGRALRALDGGRRYVFVGPRRCGGMARASFAQLVLVVAWGCRSAPSSDAVATTDPSPVPPVAAAATDPATLPLKMYEGRPDRADVLRRVRAEAGTTLAAMAALQQPNNRDPAREILALIGDGS